MSQREFGREIPPDEQLREVSLILMQALYRLRRHGPPPRPPRAIRAPGSVSLASTTPRPKRTRPKPYHAKWKPGTREHQLKNLFQKRKRVPQKAIFWRDHAVSIQDVPWDQLDRATSHTHQATLDMEFREAFDHAMRGLCPEDRRIAALVAEHGMAYAAREVGVSWRQIDNALARMRPVFEEAGFDPVARPSSPPHNSMMPRG